VTFGSLQLRAHSSLWYGGVLADWNVERFKHIASIRNGQVDPEDSRYKDLPLFAPNHIESGTGRLLGVESADAQGAESGKYLVEAGEVVYCKIRPALRKVMVAPFQGLCSADMYPVQPTSRVDARFLFYAMLGDGFSRYTLLESDRVAMPKINREALGECIFVHPEREQQIRIAAFLDRKAAAIDDLIAKQERLIELIQEKRQALITQAVTKGLDPNAPMKESGIPWIGGVPSKWKIVAVKRAAKPGPRTFTDGDWIETPFITDDGVRLIQTGNVGIGRYKEQGFRYVSDRTFHELRCTEVDPGDVLICRLDGPVGRACIAPNLGVHMITSVDNAILKPRADCDARYLVYVLSSPKYLDWVQVLCRVGGGFRFRVSRSMLGDIQIPMPPGEDQSRIADVLDEQTARLVALEHKLDVHCERLKEYRQALITAAVTGKIDVSKEAA
jgi:type I restriction enzyme S subunit